MSSVARVIWFLSFAVEPRRSDSGNGEKAAVIRPSKNSAHVRAAPTKNQGRFRGEFSRFSSRSSSTASLRPVLCPELSQWKSPAPSDSFSTTGGPTTTFSRRPSERRHVFPSGFPFGAADRRSGLSGTRSCACASLLGSTWNVFLISAYAIAGASSFLFNSSADWITPRRCVFRTRSRQPHAIMIGYVVGTSKRDSHAFACCPLCSRFWQLIRDVRCPWRNGVAVIAGALMWLGHASRFV